MKLARGDTDPSKFGGAQYSDVAQKLMRGMGWTGGGLGPKFCLLILNK